MRTTGEANLSDDVDVRSNRIAPGRVPATARLGTTVMERAASSPSSPLPDDARGRFESSLGTDLSEVRVHTGEESAEAARSIGAKAYTIGNDIHFGRGQYAPADPFGVHLLAHEVAHTVQQSGGSPEPRAKLELTTTGDAVEQAADAAADRMVAGASARLDGASRSIAREPDAAAAPAPAPTPMVSCDGPDYWSMKQDADASAPLVQAFVAADGEQYGVAAAYGIDLDDPAKAVALLKPAPAAGVAAPAQGPTNAERDRNVMNVARGQMTTNFGQLRIAMDGLSAARRKQQNTPSPMGQAPDRAPDSTPNDVEQAWDLIVSFMSMGLDAGLAQFALTLAGTDVAKNAVMAAAAQLTQLTDQVDRCVVQIDDMVARWQLDANIDVQHASQAVAITMQSFEQSFTTYRQCLQTYLEDVTATLAPGPAANPAAPAQGSTMSAADKSSVDQYMQTGQWTPPAAGGAAPTAAPPAAAPSAAQGVSAMYQAIVKANEAYQVAKVAVIAGQLAPGRLPYWRNILVPLGTPVLDAPDSGQPGAMVGDMYVFVKGSTEYLFRDKAEEVARLSAEVDNVGRVYESGPKVERRAAAWAAAMQSAAGLR
jgi:hypothetical protein